MKKNCMFIMSCIADFMCAQMAYAMYRSEKKNSNLDWNEGQKKKYFSD